MKNDISTALLSIILPGVQEENTLAFTCRGGLRTSFFRMTIFVWVDRRAATKK